MQQVVGTTFHYISSVSLVEYCHGPGGQTFSLVEYCHGPGGQTFSLLEYCHGPGGQTFSLLEYCHGPGGHTFVCESCASGFPGNFVQARLTCNM